MKCVVFDLGGVVVRIRRSWREAAIHAGIQDDVVLSLADAQWQDLVDALQRGVMHSTAFAREVANRSRNVVGEAIVSRIHRGVLAGEYARVGDLLDALHRNSILTACLSNTDDLHWSMMEDGYPAVSRIQTRFASHLIGARKPESKAFRHVESQLGLEPEDIMYFDDVSEFIDAARDRGWNAHVIDHRYETAQQMESILKQYGVVHATTLTDQDRHTPSA